VIRQATAEDIEFVVDLIREFDGLKLWPDPLRLNEDDFRQTVRGLIGQGVIFLSERGFIALTVYPSLYNYSVRIASEMSFYAPDGRGDELRRAAEAWAAERADILVMGGHEPGPIERIARWYRRKGYAPTARLFAKRVR